MKANLQQLTTQKPIVIVRFIAHKGAGFLGDFLNAH